VISYRTMAKKLSYSSYTDTLIWAGGGFLEPPPFLPKDQENEKSVYQYTDSVLTTPW